MSQHIISLPTPGDGLVEFTMGFDPRLEDFFVNALQDGEGIYMSPPNLDQQDIGVVIKERFGVDLPETVSQAVIQDAIDFRFGASDIGRRLYMYDALGVLQELKKW